MDKAYTPPAETVEAFEDCLDTADAVAVVAAPWSGREALLDRAEAREGSTTRVTLDGPTDEPPDIPAAGRVLVADCHHLYRREIDGFDPLAAFCRDLTRTDATVVTGWNETAWSYLDATTDVGTTFDQVFEVPPLDTDQAERLLFETTATDDPETELAAYAESPSPDVDRKHVRARLTRLLRGTAVDHLEGLVEDAAGNPRTIRTLFRCRTQQGIDGRPGDPDVDYDRSYLLWLVLANEGLSVEQLAGRVDRPIETALASLVREGLVTVEDGQVWVPPAAFPDVRAHLDGRRLRW